MQYVLLPLQMFLLTILQEILERERKMVITLWPDCEPTIAVFALFICHRSTPAFLFSVHVSCIFHEIKGGNSICGFHHRLVTAKCTNKPASPPLSTLPSPYETLEP